MIKLEFGNPEHIGMAQRGMVCRCGHTMPTHNSYGCNGVSDGGDEQWCQCDCGDEHLRQADCECEKFEINLNMEFNPQLGVYVTK